MADRERKRSERRKRKQRSSATENGQPAPSAPPSEPEVSPRERMKRGYAKAEVKNQAVRDSLTPLAEGQRPTVVTIGAVISAVVATSIMIGYVAGVEVDGSQPKLIQAVAPAFLMGVMAWGLLRARYWAVLGFQLILVFLIFSAIYGLALQAATLPQIISTVGLLLVAGTFFYFMVKAMARIQMPTREPRR